MEDPGHQRRDPGREDAGGSKMPLRLKRSEEMLRSRARARPAIQVKKANWRSWAARSSPSPRELEQLFGEEPAQREGPEQPHHEGCDVRNAGALSSRKACPTSP